MEIPTTKEELELIFSHIHDGCDERGHCDIIDLIDLAKEIKLIDEVYEQFLLQLLRRLDPKFYVLHAICTGIKIGYLIQHPELLVVKEESEKV